jgi:ABC-type phosphate/phosphonate transport system substrate-binding protein
MADYPRYLSKVVLNGQADAAVDFKLKRVGQALRGIRSVLRGDCEATILDDEQVASAKTMTGGTELRTIHTSPALAPIPVVAFGDKTPEADRKTLVATLLAMCASSKGGPICKEMHIDRFLPYDSKIFDDVQKRFGE